MYLLERKNVDKFSLTKNLTDNIPAYAILSHTWGSDDQEVTFKDFVEGSEKSKAGYKKIRFCGEQAARDGYRCFWVDTCCIDKTNSVELSETLNSMYRWYQDAAKCYVYLTDVSTNNQKPIKGVYYSSAEAFEKSRWFTRGWTLQELIAPQSVQFFSIEGELLGNKKSLERQIYRITGIPVSALQGMPMSKFTVEERFLWAAKRETKKEEDKAYSLLGIFSVFMPLLYGEGRENAFRRLREEVEKSAKSLKFDGPSNFSLESQTRNSVQEDFMEDSSNRLEIKRRTTSWEKPGTSGNKRSIRCFRCDNNHLLDDCFSSFETVSRARTRRKKSGSCINCGSGEHWRDDCPWEDLKYL